MIAEAGWIEDENQEHLKISSLFRFYYSRSKTRTDNGTKEVIYLESVIFRKANSGRKY
jgi:hypothetical protein